MMVTAEKAERGEDMATDWTVAGRTPRRRMCERGAGGYVRVIRAIRGWRFSALAPEDSGALLVADGRKVAMMDGMVGSGIGLRRWRSRLGRVGSLWLPLFGGCLAIVWLSLWVLSLWYCHSIYVGRDLGAYGWGLNVRSTPGGMEIVAIRFEAETGRMPEGLSLSFNATAWARDRSLMPHAKWAMHCLSWRVWNETVTGYGPKYTNYYWGAALPLWLLVILCGTYPAMRWVLRPSLKHVRLARGLCVRCGYDLRATPERCPECGTAVSDK